MNDFGLDAGLNSSAGGVRAASGLMFQAQVFAWWAAHAVGGSAPGLGLDPQVRVEAVGCEIGFPVADVGVALSNGGFILVQAKSGMRRLGPRAQDFCKAVNQLVSAMIGGLSSGVPIRPVDVSRDRLVIATNQNSSQAFRALGHVCERLRDLPVSVPLGAAAVNEDQKRAYAGLLSVVRSSWTAATGREPEDDELRSFLRALEVSRFDFEDAGVDRIRCEAMLRHANIARPFSILVGIGIESAHDRTWRDKRALIAAMDAGHSPQGDKAPYAGRLPHLQRGQVPHVRDIDGHVFISYVREDSYLVDRLQRTLQDSGIPVWRDTADLWPGEDWRAEIRRAITDNALVFIACFSRASLAREKSYQNEELTLAIEQLRLRRPDDPWLIPVRFDECEIPDRDIGGGRTLSSIQRADLFGDRSDESATRLVLAIRRILGVNSGAEESEEDPEPDVADPVELDGNPAIQTTLNRSSVPSLQRSTLVMIDGDYLVAVLQPSRSVDYSGTVLDLREHLTVIFDRLAALGPITLYVTKSTSSGYHALLRSANRVRAQVNILERKEAKSPNIDVTIATVVMAQLPRIGRLILLTGDSDFVPLARHVQQAGIEVNVAYVPGRAPRELLAIGLALDLQKIATSPFYAHEVLSLTH